MAETCCVIRPLYLLADCSLYLVCGNYDFLFVGIGCQGRITNGFILRSCVNCTRNWRKALQFSHHQHLWQEGGSHFFVIDKAYVVQENIIKIYCGLYQKGPVERLFNYRLSRTRRVVKNVFGITSSYSRVLRKPLVLQPEQLDVF